MNKKIKLISLFIFLLVATIKGVGFYVVNAQEEGDLTEIPALPIPGVDLDDGIGAIIPEPELPPQEEVPESINPEQNNVLAEDPAVPDLILPANPTPAEENKDINGQQNAVTEAKTVQIPKCHEAPLMFSKCVPGMCMEESPFGTIYRQIVSYDQATNECLFKERTPGFGGLNCAFAALDLDTVEELYTKKFISRFDKNISLSEGESLGIKNINEKYCAFLEDQAATNDPIPIEEYTGIAEITSSTKLEEQEESQERIEELDSTSTVSPAPSTTLTQNDFGVQAGEGTSEATDTTETSDFENELGTTETGETTGELDSFAPGEPGQEDSQMGTQDLVDNGDVFKFKSLMFTTDEINLLNQALDAYTSGSQFTVGSEDNEEEVVAQIRSFFLKSLIYYNPDSWTIWLENSLKTEKITDSVNSSGLIIEEIKPDYVTVIWQTPNLDKISPDWRRFLISDLNNRYRHEKYDIVVLRSGESNAEVKFRLRPNQSFNVNRMQIIEGKIR